MRIRDFRPPDRAACLNLFDSNVPEFFLASERESFADFLESPGEHSYVLDIAGGEIVACGGWYIDGIVAGLSWGIVARSKHGQGFGRCLPLERLRAIRDDGRATAARVRTTPSVEAFFERAGFKVAQSGIDGVVAEVTLVELTLQLR